MSEPTKTDSKAVLPAPRVKAEVAAESTYTVAELVEQAKAFHVMPECVRAALLEQKEKTFTFPQAKAIVENFMKREVK